MAEVVIGSNKVTEMRRFSFIYSVVVLIVTIYCQQSCFARTASLESFNTETTTLDSPQLQIINQDSAEAWWKPLGFLPEDNDDSFISASTISLQQNELDDYIKGFLACKSIIDCDDDEEVLLSNGRNFKSFIRGEKARDSVNLGMWSRHFFTNTQWRESHGLVATQYRGYYLGTFTNSHDHTVVIAGKARTVAQKQIGNHLQLDLGYKLGPMYGYRKNIPQIGRMSILPLLVIGASYRNIGMDLNLFPGNAISFNTHINRDAFRRSKKETQDNL